MNIFKKSLFILFITIFLCSCTENKVSIHISNYQETNKLVLNTKSIEGQEISIDTEGMGYFQYTEKSGSYVTLYYGKQSRLLWLEPNKDLSISFNDSSFNSKIDFTGSLASINDYLNNSSLQEIMINDCGLEESRFMTKADSLLDANLKALNQAQLPDQFSNVEKNRLKYFTYSAFTFYPTFYPRISKDTTYTPSTEYISKVKELFILNDSLLSLDEYKTFITRSATFMAQHEYPTIKPSIDRNIKYVETHIDNPAIAEYLINQYVYAYIENNGIQQAQRYLDSFYNYVKDPAMLDAMKELNNKWLKIEKGKPSPDFSATDINGKKFSLSDFKGKFVYIDIWATWCGPCRKEAPYLSKMEEKYIEKDIYIISLSCDQDRDTWKNFVVKNQKGGIQLHLNSDSKFMEEYMISGIPHFILLDKEGKIVDSKMTRPSDLKTITTIDNLLSSH